MKLPSSKFMLSVLTTIVVFVVAICLCQLFSLLGFPEQSQVDEVRRCAGWTWQFAGTVALVLIGAPVVEETMFRFPTRFIRHPAFAVGMSALFSLCHYIDFASIFTGHGFLLQPVSNAFVALFFVGLAWCWLYRHTKSLWCSMLSHSLFNTINLVLALTIAR